MHSMYVISCYCFGNKMSNNSNRAKEKAKRNRMPSLDLVSQSIMKNLPGLSNETRLLD